MKIEVRKKGEVSILDVRGRLCIGDGDIELRDCFGRLLEEGWRLFVLNFQQVPYMDSAAIGETVACSKRVHERRGEIKIVVVPDGKPDQVLRITHLDRVFELYDDVGHALASFIPHRVAS